LIEFICPRDGEQLAAGDGSLTCPAGHSYGVVDGIPLLLDPEAAPTQPGYWATDEESYPSEERAQPVGDNVDQYVRWLLKGTCGNLFDADRLNRYPIPTLPLTGPGRFLDLGSNWGRWTIAATRAGFDAVGVDPSLGAIRAARRVARQLNASIDVAVADARHLPFPDQSFDVVFSYSVLQHLAPVDVEQALAECARVLRPGGISLHQMPSKHGPLNTYRQFRRGLRAATGFEVHYWHPSELRETFDRFIGPTTFSADGFLTINPHAGDLTDLKPVPRAVVRASRAFTALSRRVPVLHRVADSLWVRSARR
jgi:ubiquinone/menaquinone biosynthesis C-methylase UbiE